MAKLLSRRSLSAITLLSIVVSVTALNCTAPEKPLPPDSCLTVLPGKPQTANFGDSRGRCVSGGFTGLLVVADEQFGNLARYAQVILTENQFFWLGYSYSSNTVLQDTSFQTIDSSSAILNLGNYGTGEQAEPGVGVCIAIGSNGTLYRRQCSELQGAFCQRIVEAPSANITVDPGRFIAIGTPVTLTCVTSGSGVDVSWVANLGSNPEPFSSSSSISINAFTAEQEGAYYCIASNELGGFVSEPVVLMVGSDPSSGEEVPTVSITAGQTSPYIFGSILSLSCDFGNSVSAVQWFINDRPVEETNRDGQTSSLQVASLLEGYYQCFVRTSNGLSAADRVLVEAQAGTPGVVDLITAGGDTRDQLYVSWVCPEVINTHDPALLRYIILYHPGVLFAMNMTVVLPVTPSGLMPVMLDGEEVCIVEALVPGVEQGTPYVIKVVAMTSVMTGGVATDFAAATTYGAAPPQITDLNVTRSSDSKQVLANWGKVETAPLIGTVSRYGIQYRDSEKGSVGKVFVSIQYNYWVLNNIINANSYEVRVRAETVVQRDPVMYDGIFSSWVKVDGITINIPTEQPLATSPAIPVSAIAAGVTVGVLVFLLIVLILCMGFFCCLYQRMDHPKCLRKETSPSVTLGLKEASAEEQKFPE